MAGIVPLLILVVVLVGFWKVFEKAGQPGWAGIVPIYNLYVLVTQILKFEILWFILAIIPIVCIIAAFKIFIALAEKFGKGVGFGVLMVFFPFICVPILGFGAAKFQGAASAPPAAPAE